MLRRLVVLLLITVASLSPTATVAANDDGPKLRAMLGPTVIDPRDVGRYHCHDLDYPVITCFRSSDALEEAVESHQRDQAGPTAVPYVRIFETSTFQGASVTLAQNYPRLSDIGWNDRISSFRSVNGGSGTFFKNAQFLGDSYTFCCDQQFPNMAGAWNDAISSVSGSA